MVIPSLRHISMADLPQALETLRQASANDASGSESGEILTRRVKHVVTENARVLDAVQTLRDGELAALGTILTACHISLRDAYEIIVPQLDRSDEHTSE